MIPALRLRDVVVGLAVVVTGQILWAGLWLMVVIAMGFMAICC